MTLEQLLRARPARLPYFVVPFPVPAVLGGGRTLTLFIVLGRN